MSSSKTPYERLTNSYSNNNIINESGSDPQTKVKVKPIGAFPFYVNWLVIRRRYAPGAASNTVYLSSHVFPAGRRRTVHLIAITPANRSFEENNLGKLEAKVDNVRACEIEN